MEAFVKHKERIAADLADALATLEQIGNGSLSAIESAAVAAATAMKIRNRQEGAGPGLPRTGDTAPPPPLTREVEERLRRIEESVRGTSEEISEYRRTRSGAADILARTAARLEHVTAELEAWTQAYALMMERADAHPLPIAYNMLNTFNDARLAYLRGEDPSKPRGVPAVAEAPDAPEGNVVRPGGSQA